MNISKALVATFLLFSFSAQAQEVGPGAASFVLNPAESKTSKQVLLPTSIEIFDIEIDRSNLFEPRARIEGAIDGEQFSLIGSVSKSGYLERASERTYKVRVKVFEKAFPESMRGSDEPHDVIQVTLYFELSLDGAEVFDSLAMDGMIRHVQEYYENNSPVFSYSKR